MTGSAAIVALAVSSHLASRFRAGLAFGLHPVFVELKSLEESQYQAIISDPHLNIRELSQDQYDALTLPDEREGDAVLYDPQASLGHTIYAVAEHGVTFRYGDIVSAIELTGDPASDWVTLSNAVADFMSATGMVDAAQAAEHDHAAKAAEADAAAKAAEADAAPKAAVFATATKDAVAHADKAAKAKSAK